MAHSLLILTLIHIIIWLAIARFRLGKIDVFHPFYLISVLYILIFVYAPNVWLEEGRTSYLGVEVMSYLPEGLLVFNIGYFFFAIGYMSYARINYLQINRKEEHENGLLYEESDDIRNIVLRFAWILFSVSIIFSLIYYYLTGRNLIFMLTLGQGSERLAGRDGLGIYFLAQFIRSAIPALLLILAYSKRITIIRIVALYVTVAICVSSGSRNLALCAMTAIAVLYYLKKGKRPSLLIIILGMVSVYFFVGFIGMFRSTFKYGGDINIDEMTSTSLHNAFMFNVEIFYPFFVLAHKMLNNLMSCHYGLGIVNMVVQFVPRAIWPSKPISIGLYGIEAAIGSDNGGAAYPNIAEFYYETGMIGMIVLMFMFGRHMHKLYGKYCNNLDRISQVRFALVYGYILQFVCRGHFPSWGLDFLFMFMPIVILERYILKR